MEIINKDLFIDDTDLGRIDELLVGGIIDLDECVNVLFMLMGDSPAYVQEVRFYRSPKDEEDKRIIEMVLQAVREFIQHKKND
ncbi:hypothetical protein [Domibacillus iocasae]|uniref:Uncharacterized protein n=1 Tax=Domibacillus iocasae TaxID=1714016 RepID=A0A1E7DQX0_9BACI|nr:hypothetical protein [Domibacillus iocasae]OES45453.1 hypothetical protein BA724_17530 [Domibacillus iocasae]